MKKEIFQDYNALHMNAVTFKQDYGDTFKKNMCGLCTSSIEVNNNDFVVAIIFHKSTGFNPAWISFRFNETDYKQFCTETIGLLCKDHKFIKEINEEANKLKNALKKLNKKGPMGE